MKRFIYPGLSLFLILVFSFQLATCSGGGGGGGNGASGRESSISLYSDSTTSDTAVKVKLAIIDTPDSPIALVGMEAKEMNEAIVLFAEKDENGDVIRFTNIVFYDKATNQGVNITLDENNLPVSLIGSDNSEVKISNYTDTSIDITVYDSSGSLISGPTTVEEDVDQLKAFQRAVSENLTGRSALNDNNALPDSVRRIKGLKALSRVLGGASASMGAGSCMSKLRRGPKAVAVACGSAAVGAGLEILDKYVDSPVLDAVVDFLPTATTIADCVTVDILACASLAVDAVIEVDKIINGEEETADACAEAGGDTDGDGVCNAVDNCPDIANTDQLDSDGNGIGDVCESTKIYRVVVTGTDIYDMRPCQTYHADTLLVMKYDVSGEGTVILNSDGTVGNSISLTRTLVGDISLSANWRLDMGGRWSGNSFTAFFTGTFTKSSISGSFSDQGTFSCGDDGGTYESTSNWRLTGQRAN